MGAQRPGEERAREELVAELGACFLSADLGIVPELEPRPDHASYFASWLEVLSNDKRFMFSAAAHAQRAVAPSGPKAASCGREMERRCAGSAIICVERLDVLAGFQ
jgi:antirestriction protein ArdC